jgi:mono/diheme cytochrome c family protein
MREMRMILLMALLGSSAFSESGKKVFETFCWGCHHQTAVAFGPPFEEIASHRNSEEIRAMIVDPATVSKEFGYQRNAMPAFRLSEENLSSIASYILSFAPQKSDHNQTQKADRTKPQGAN